MATEGTPTLNATVREGTGKGVARKLRAQGMIPAICYGAGIENISISIDPDEFDKIKERPKEINTVFDVALDNGKKVENVMLRNYQVDPVRRKVIHADLISVNMEEPIKVKVPIETRGKAEGVKMGGRLRFIHPHVEVMARPNDIPTSVSVDVSDLSVDGAIRASDLEYPEGVEPFFKVDYAVVRIQMPRAKMVTAATTAAAALALEEEGEEGEGEEGEEGSEEESEE